MMAVQDKAAAGRAGAPATVLPRLAVVGGAVVAAVLVWLVATQLIGVDLHSPAFSETQPSQPIGVGPVIVVSLVAGLAGWGVLALLERLAPVRARLVWTIIAAAVLVFSLGGPLSGTGVTSGSRAVLVLLHVVVGAVLIAGLPRARKGGTA